MINPSSTASNGQLNASYASCTDIIVSPELAICMIASDRRDRPIRFSASYIRVLVLEFWAVWTAFLCSCRI